jgi:hypothetical protein
VNFARTLAKQKLQSTHWVWKITSFRPSNLGPRRRSRSKGRVLERQIAAGRRNEAHRLHVQLNLRYFRRDASPFRVGDFLGRHEFGG